ncbi:UNVERIFIED_CONTAM: hypothetical protein Sradi_3841500 [Sesamum radiatum]|uniref:Integrase catalytic domain-containing protein n=1 Tax=Sesamum radiatum TaxID=300843 RepID=A0AAW2Q1G2_SESRA
MGHGHSGTIPTGTQVRVTPRINNKQWSTISSSKNTRLVYRIAHKIEIHLGISSQANGQVEVTNRILVQGIKKRLDRAGGAWVEELTSVLWSYRTTPRGSTGEIPFTMVYGIEAIIPAELGMPSHRILHFDEEHNSQLLKENLDLIDELRDSLHTNSTIQKHNDKCSQQKGEGPPFPSRRPSTTKVGHPETNRKARP